MGWWSLKKELFTYFFITSTVILIFLGIILYSVMDRTIYERVQKDQKLFLENQLQLVDSNLDRKSTRLNSSHITRSRMPSSA